MELVYRQQELVNTSRADCFGRLRPEAMLSLMQEAAGMHCHALGVGRDMLNTRHLFWAVIRQRVQIDRLPVIGETMTLETWPGEATRAAYPRYTVARDQTGKVLFRGAALWLIMDGDNRTMILPGKTGLMVPGVSREEQIALPGSLPPAVLDHQETRTVRYSELDANGHMSNTRYLNWLEDLFPAQYHRDHPLREFQISYLSEAREGQSIHMTWDLGPEGELRLEGRRTEGNQEHRVFALKAKYL